MLSSSFLVAKAYACIVIAVVIFVGVSIEVLVFFRIIVILGLNLLVLLIVIADAFEADFTLLEVIRDGIVLRALDTHELTGLSRMALPCFQDDLHIEELVASPNTLEFHSINIWHSEVYDWLGDEDHRLLQEVQPTVLGLQATLDVGTTLGGFEVPTGNDEIDYNDATEQLSQNFFEFSLVLWLDVLQVG